MHAAHRIPAAADARGATFVLRQGPDSLWMEFELDRPGLVTFVVSNFTASGEDVESGNGGGSLQARAAPCCWRQCRGCALCGPLRRADQDCVC